MALSGDELAAVKRYIRVETDDDDELISELHAAAVEYLINAGVDPLFGNSLYNLAVRRLILHFYDHRDAAVEKGGAEPIPGISAMILQLRCAASANEM